MKTVEIRVQTLSILAALGVGLVSGAALATLGGTTSRWVGDKLIVVADAEINVVDAGFPRSVGYPMPIMNPNDAGTTYPRCIYGRQVLASNAAIVSFNPAFAVLPACTCSHEAATPIACGPTAAATTTGVTFGVPAGSGTISWQCCGPR
jgi:hypothetical protein